jgi:hypothetical protein
MVDLDHITVDIAKKHLYILNPKINMSSYIQDNGNIDVITVT